LLLGRVDLDERRPGGHAVARADEDPGHLPFDLGHDGRRVAGAERGHVVGRIVDGHHAGHLDLHRRGGRALTLAAAPAAAGGQAATTASAMSRALPRINGRPETTTTTTGMPAALTLAMASTSSAASDRSSRSPLYSA